MEIKIKYMRPIIVVILLAIFWGQVGDAAQYPIFQHELEWKISMEIGDDSYLVSYEEESPTKVQSDTILLLNGLPVVSTVKYQDKQYFIDANTIGNFFDKREVFEEKQIMLDGVPYFSLQSFQNEEYNSGVFQAYEGCFPFVWIDRKLDIEFSKYSEEQAIDMVYQHFSEEIAINAVPEEDLESVGGPVSMSDFLCRATIGNYYYITMPTMKAGHEGFDIVVNNVTGTFFYLLGKTLL